MSIVSCMIMIEEVTELSEMTKIVRRSIFLLLSDPAKFWGAPFFVSRLLALFNSIPTFGTMNQ